MQIVAFLTCWSFGWEAAGAQLPGSPVSRLIKTELVLGWLHLQIGGPLAPLHLGYLEVRTYILLSPAQGPPTGGAWANPAVPKLTCRPKA